MLFNCFSCGKRVSSKKEACPYCKMHITAVTQEMLTERSHGTLSEKYKDTIFAFTTRHAKI